MKVLLLGDYLSAMFILASEPGYIINMIPIASDNDINAIERYINLCGLGTSSTAVTFYNDTPWSHLKMMRDSESDRITNMKRKLYDLAGWKPDLIIYVYSPEENTPVMDMDMDGIPVFSTNVKDHQLHRNLISIIDEYQKKYQINYND